MEQLVFLLIIGGVTLAKWLIEKSSELRERKKTEERLDRLGREEPDPAPPLTQRQAGPEEAARKFLEALGLPPESAPPPPVIRPVPPIIVESEIPRFFEPKPEKTPPPLVIEAGDLERRLFESRKPPAPPTSAALRKERQRKATPVIETTLAEIPIEKILRTREGLRRAVLAREILGPPKGLDF